ncbi:hypothetical protein PAXINDRAFT_15227 [Paxillus involutus ATCC 200175]|uniref:Uncharacterized protein n=1 Tax=Paxillus involutus ATCC 200175 TaxID=664439 RepID=A0A0C9T8A2_PAXIN|nr:hypothetical protein PAXINDRAFT_15227 [Paxillus involutus ATCC 200175]
MPFTDANDLSPEPTAIPSDPPTYSPPTDGNMAAVAVTVGIVGVFMFTLITWLVLRLRRSPSSQIGFSTSPPKPVRPVSDISISDRFRPSFAPSEASSKFGFMRKSLRLAHQRDDGSWDFADPDPIPGSKESPFVSYTMPKQRPPPLSPTTPTSPTWSSYSPRSKRSSTQKDEFSPRTPSTPSTPGTFDFIEPPPPVYCKDGTSWPLYQPKDLSLC